MTRQALQSAAEVMVLMSTRASSLAELLELLQAHHWSEMGSWKLAMLGAAGRMASRSAAAGSPASFTMVDMTDSRSGGKG